MPKTETKTKKAVSAEKKAAPARETSRASAAKETAPPQKKEKQEMAKPVAKAPAVKEPEKPKAKVPFRKEIAQKLLDEKSKILHEVSAKVKTESNVLKHEIGDIYDIASNERERELTLMLGDRDRDKLSEIEEALERLKDNTFGVCEECGENIAENRLRALPATRVCVECMSRMEKEAKIKGRFEEEAGLGIMDRSEGEEEEF